MKKTKSLELKKKKKKKKGKLSSFLGPEKGLLVYLVKIRQSSPFGIRVSEFPWLLLASDSSQRTMDCAVVSGSVVIFVKSDTVPACESPLQTAPLLVCCAVIRLQLLWQLAVLDSFST